MEHIIKSLQSMRICTTSYIRGAQDIGALRESHDNDRYNQLLASWFDFHEPLDAPLAELTVGYVTQDVIKVKIGKKVVTGLGELYRNAVAQASAFASVEPWHWVKDEEETLTPVKHELSTMERIFVDRRLQLTTREMVKLFVDQFGTSSHSSRYHVMKLIEKHGPTKRLSDVDGESRPLHVRMRKWVSDNDVTNKTRSEIVEEMAKALNAKRTSVNSMITELIKEGVVTPVATKRKSPNRGSPVNNGQWATAREWALQQFSTNPSVSREQFIQSAVAVGLKHTTAVTYYSTLRPRQE